MMVRTRRRDAGIAMFVVVILMLLTMVLVVAAVVMWSDYKDSERTLAALKAQRDLLVRQEDDIKQAVIKCNEATGLVMGEDGKLPAAKAAEAMKKWREEYFSVSALDKYPLTPPLQGEPQRIKKELQDGFNRSKDESSYMRTLQELVEPAAARAFHYKNRMEQLQVELGIAADQTKNRASIQDELPKKKNERRDELRKDIAAVTAEIGKENTAYEERKKLYAEARSKAEAEVPPEVEKFAADEIKVQNEIRELRRQIEELKVKEIVKQEVNFVHGRVLRPDVPNRTAFINIGSRERVVPGLKFLVGRRGVQGKFEYKGKLEVKKAWMTYAECSIVELYDPTMKPITEGDHIVNPLFSKERPIVLAFVGEERPVRLRYSVDEASRRIREIGSEVRKDVGLDVDYVVFTEAGPQKTPDNYEAFKKAVFLEIPVAEASDIFRFLGD
jgi:hypothetical protein